MVINMQSVQNMGYESYLTKDYHAGTDTTITVYDATKLPAAPNSICIASRDNSDTVIVKYTAITGNVLTVDTITHYNRPGAESRTYMRGCNVYKEFSDTVSGGGGGSGGTDNYNALSNKPQINGIQLQANKSSDDLGLVKKNWGVAQSGKVLTIGLDGLVYAASGSSGTTDYNVLINKPKINSVELQGDVSLNTIGAFKRDWSTSYNGYVIKIVDGVAQPVNGTTSTVAFADITGQPDDNVALDAALDAKVNKTWGTTYDGKVLGIQSGQVVPVNQVTTVAWGNIQGTNPKVNVPLKNELEKLLPYDAASTRNDFTIGTETVGGEERIYLNFP